MAFLLPFCRPTHLPDGQVCDYRRERQGGATGGTAERYRDEFLAAEREFAEAGGERIFGRHDGLIKDFAAYVEQVLAEQGRPTTEPGRVPAVVLWLVDEETYVGRVTFGLG